MIEKRIHLGFEIGTGKPVTIPMSHLIVTGITQLSGKTTTLEALIGRSSLRAVVFRTKPGEKSFSTGTPIAPFFRDRSDYEFVKSLIEAYSREKIFIEKGALMKLCKGSKDLVEIKQRVDTEIAGGKLRGIKEEIYTRLQHYLEHLIPQIKYANFSTVLRLDYGVNIVNLEKFSDEAQSLIIESTASEILKTMGNVIMVIPEAWKFIPQRQNNPCKRSVEAFIRQGATNRNYIWIDSQDMAGVDKTILKSISTWLLGYQSERNEVKHTLDQITQPKKLKPTEDQIMTLKIGQFYVSTSDGVVKVYVQPDWLRDTEAKLVAMGSEPRPKPENLSRTEWESPPVHDNNCSAINIDRLKSEIVEAVIPEVLKRLPTSDNGRKYTIAPAEALKKQFLQDEKARMLDRIGKLTPDQKRLLKFIESAGHGLQPGEIAERCFGVKNAGSSFMKMKDLRNSLGEQQLIRLDDKSRSFPNLRNLLSNDLQFHGATDEEVEQVYNHILAEML